MTDKPAPIAHFPLPFEAPIVPPSSPLVPPVHPFSIPIAPVYTRTVAGQGILETIELGNYFVHRLANSSLVAVAKDDDSNGRKRRYLPQDPQWLAFIRDVVASLTDESK